MPVPYRSGLRQLVLAWLVLAICPAALHAQEAVLFDRGTLSATIVHDTATPATLAAAMLARDLHAVTGAEPPVRSAMTDCARLCIVVGPATSPVVQAVAQDAGIDLTALEGGWERYVRVLAPSRADPRRQYLLIAGSDQRGAIWGITDLSREIGVSAWEWWADVTPERRDRVTVDGTLRLSDAPSVQYRGIFLNDEDWGLQPWAAGFEPEVGDIGPRTYSRIFELMWRLKANIIWPAMHDSTRPFYQVPGNAQAARDHAIVVGTSHAEPLMRNNVREWDDDLRGPFNFFTNRDALVTYWRDRVQEVSAYENVYTIGLRGKHDSGMEGAAGPEQARDALAEVIGIQRGLLADAQGRPAADVPQVLTLYKEVQDVYAAGLAVPDDVTLVWPEDNYGYVKQLPNRQERQRSGGSGLYYHISYWGRPHDYLWLGTTHPALIREQLDRTWQMDARRIWIVNVGDIKPAEYLTQYFLDLAFDHRLFATTPRDHLAAWATRQFGAERAEAVAAAMTEYYDLAFPRRPEFMGFNQVEPTRPVQVSDYIRTGGAEAEARLARYAALLQQVEALAAGMPANRADAFFQLVLYPVRAAASMNERVLHHDLAMLAARRGQSSAAEHVRQSRAAHDRIVADTAAYNALGGGKWRGMMDMAPRNLPVFQPPLFPEFGDLPPAAATPAPVAPTCTISLASTDAAAPGWEAVPGLGSRGAALRSRLDGRDAGTPLVYTFTTAPNRETSETQIAIVALPVHPLTGADGVRIAVRLDDGPVQVLDYETIGRSEEWKRNVLSNSTTRVIDLKALSPGEHRLEIIARDPGFLLDRIDVRVDGTPDFYGAPPPC